MNSPELAPAFIMADLGYDVWLGNNRGNIYGQQHLNYTLHSAEFWDFDFETMGIEDLPTIINYVLE